eukprot:5036827-Prymnesium_polylepis.1
MQTAPNGPLAPHLLDLLASVQDRVGSKREPDADSSAEQIARHNSELLARQNRELISALHAQQQLVVQQESEMRRLRSALSGCDRAIPKGGDHPMGSPTSPFDVLPLADSLSSLPLGRSGRELQLDEVTLPISKELTEPLALSVPLQQGLLYAALDTHSTNSVAAPLDSFALNFYPHLGHATTTHSRSVELVSPLQPPPPTLPVSC